MSASSSIICFHSRIAIGWFCFLLKWNRVPKDLQQNKQRTVRLGKCAFFIRKDEHNANILRVLHKPINDEKKIAKRRKNIVIIMKKN